MNNNLSNKYLRELKKSIQSIVSDNNHIKKDIKEIKENNPNLLKSIEEIDDKLEKTLKEKELNELNQNISNISFEEILDNELLYSLNNQIKDKKEEEELNFSESDQKSINNKNIPSSEKNINDKIEIEKIKPINIKKEELTEDSEEPEHDEINRYLKDQFDNLINNINDKNSLIGLDDIVSFLSNVNQKNQEDKLNLIFDENDKNIDSINPIIVKENIIEKIIEERDVDNENLQKDKTDNLKKTEINEKNKDPINNHNIEILNEFSFIREEREEEEVELLSPIIKEMKDDIIKSLEEYNNFYTANNEKETDPLDFKNYDNKNNIENNYIIKISKEKESIDDEINNPKKVIKSLNKKDNQNNKELNNKKDDINNNIHKKIENTYIQNSEINTLLEEKINEEELSNIQDNFKNIRDNSQISITNYIDKNTITKLNKEEETNKDREEIQFLQENYKNLYDKMNGLIDEISLLSSIMEKNLNQTNQTNKNTEKIANDLNSNTKSKTNNNELETKDGANSSNEEIVILLKELLNVFSNPLRISNSYIYRPNNKFI